MKNFTLVLGEFGPRWNNGYQQVNSEELVILIDIYRESNGAVFFEDPDGVIRAIKQEQVKDAEKAGWIQFLDGDEE